MAEFLAGIAWALIGLHVLDWCADKRGQQMAVVFGGLAGTRWGWIVGWAFITLWPAAALLVITAEAGEAGDC